MSIQRYVNILMCLLIVAAMPGLAICNSAMATPAHRSPVAGIASHVIQVHDDGADHGRRWRRHRSNYDEARRGEVVDAPFTHVESGRHTLVDAPFAHVYVGAGGRHVVAPFVNLWIPR